MISKEEVRELLKSTETYRIERTTSTGDMISFKKQYVLSQTIYLIPRRMGI